MSRDARVEGDVLVQKIRLTKFCFEALKFEHYTNVKTSFCFSMVHTGLQARFQKNKSQIKKPLFEIKGQQAILYSLYIKANGP